jgi:hypothetical protein
LGRHRPTGESSPRAVLTEKLVLKLRAAFLKKKSVKAVAEKFELNYSTAYFAIRGASWAHLPNASAARKRGQ